MRPTQTLRAARSRIRRILFLGYAESGMLMGAGLLVVLQAWTTFTRKPGIDLRWATGTLLAILVYAGLKALLKPISLQTVARLLDDTGQTHDRFVTALSLENANDPSPLETLARHECQTYLDTHDFRHWLPVRWPRKLLWLWVPALALAALQWTDTAMQREQLASQAAARIAIDPALKALDELARKAQTAADVTGDPGLKALAEQIKAGTKKLEATASDPKSAGKAALEQMSTLENLMRALASAPSSATKQDMADLGQKLASEDVLPEAAKALQAGRTGEAASALEEAAKDPAAKERAEAALKRALEQMAQERKLSAAMESLAQQNGALQKLAGALRSMEGKSAGQNAASKQALQQLMAALQNLKNGDAQPNANPGGPGNPQNQNKGDAQVLVQTFGNPNAEQASVPSLAQQPGGNPGSDKDLGTTASPYGTRPEGQGEFGSKLQLRGQLGEGESLSALLPASPDKSKATQRYKELYEAMAPAANDAALQEDIPLGSRFMIQRYFQSIRP